MTRRINQNRTHYNVSVDLARQTKEAHAAKKPGVVVYDRDAGVGQIPPQSQAACGEKSCRTMFGTMGPAAARVVMNSVTTTA